MENREQPGPQVRPRLEPIGGAEGFEIGVLHQILRVGPVAAQPKGRPVEAVEVDERLALESGRLARGGRPAPVATPIRINPRAPAFVNPGSSSLIPRPWQRRIRAGCRSCERAKLLRSGCHASHDAARRRAKASEGDVARRGQIRLARGHPARQGRYFRAQRLQVPTRHSKIATLASHLRSSVRGTAYAHAHPAACFRAVCPGPGHRRCPGRVCGCGRRADAVRPVLREEQNPLRQLRVAHLPDGPLRNLLLPGARTAPRAHRRLRGERVSADQRRLEARPARSKCS